MRRGKRHPEDAERWVTSKRSAEKALKKAPKKYRATVARVRRWKGGKEALGKFRAFTGIPLPPSIRFVKGPGKVAVVGMGNANEIVYHDGRKIRRRRGRWFGVTDSKGRRILLLNRRNMRKGVPAKPALNPIGRMVETHYGVPNDVENAGSPKRGTHWVHKHKDQGGKWPPGYEDQNGNIWYGAGTYRVHRWIRR